MIAVTENAKKVLKSILLSKVDNRYAFLRLLSSGEGELGLGIDIEQPGDNAVEYEGSKLLLVDCELADSLKGVTLDIDHTPEGPELVIICG
ncbi:MAG: hypothetical protein Q8O55_06260 [Dehalococcoidales bacterium]|nr:hypothetical protein [Dehalococcoidales bacterium]